MDSLKAALERLDVAIDHLETALDGYAARRRAERDALVAALEAARIGEIRAREKVNTVSARLDAAIERLQSVLEE